MPQHDGPVYENRGKPPRDSDAVVGVIFRNGTTGTYLAKQLRWKPWPSGEHPGDVVRFWRA